MTCGNGHDLTDENVYLTSAGHRKCRSCALGVKAEMRKRGHLGIVPRKRTNWQVPKGERNASAKLSDREVVEIRAKIAAGAVQSHIAREYGVTPALISLIKLGRHRI